MPLTGVIASTSYGWPLAFQIFGAAGLVWCVLWIIIGSNNPASHKYISKEELFYIESSLEEVKEEEVSNKIFHINIVVNKIIEIIFCVKICSSKWHMPIK